MAVGRVTATVVESRSTGELDGLAQRVVLLSGKPSGPTSWSSPWSRQVLTAFAAVTRARVGVFAWQSAEEPSYRQVVVRDRPPGDERPTVHDLKWNTTLTHAAEAGRAMDLSVSANGHSAIAYVRHRRGADHSSVAGVSFDVTRRGGLRRQIDVTWQQPVNVTVIATSSRTSASITLGQLIHGYVVSPRTQYSVGP